MRQLICFFLLIASLNVIGQKVSSNKTIDISALGSLLAKKATVNEVTQALGDPTEESATPDRASLQYGSGENLYLLRFGKDKKLYSFFFVNQSKNQPDKLSYETVKQARNIKTKQGISATLGEPTQITAKDGEETWYYIYEENSKETQKTLIVRFDLSNPDAIQRFSFTAELKNTTAISSAAVNDLVVGSSTPGDVENKLGKPSQILLDAEQEKWYYTSQKTSLVVYFDKQSKVNDYSYQKSSN